jgi:hypothetical protein
LIQSHLTFDFDGESDQPHRHVLHGRRRLRIFNIVMGALLALSIALIVS